MRRLIAAVFLGGVCLSPAGAQFAPYRDRDPWHNTRPRSFRAGIVERTLSDLDRTRSYRRVDGHERKHFEHARRDLLRFQEKWARGQFDRGRLDTAIEHLSHLAHSDQMHPRDRQILAADLYALRDLRAGGARERRGW